MRIRVLGSAAGGGFPQWNCGCDNCRDVRSGVPGLRARTQESLAVSADGEAWYVLNVSPEIRAQIESFPGLHPRAARHSPIAGLVLTNGDLDHCLGLFSLRESHPLQLFATRSVERGLRQDNVLFRTLQRFPEQLTFHPLPLAGALALPLGDGRPSGLTLEAVPVPGKLPIHLEQSGQPNAEDNIGLLVREPARGRTLAYFPAVAGPCPPLEAAVAQADCVFFDGTFWSSDELPSGGLGTKRAEDMAHWPLGGPGGSLAWLRGLSTTHSRPALRGGAGLVTNPRPALRGGAGPQRVLIHINNTNPILRAGSPQARQLSEAGVLLAEDGLELTL